MEECSGTRVSLELECLQGDLDLEKNETQHSTGDLRQHNEAREEMKGIKDWRGRNKICVFSEASTVLGEIQILIRYIIRINKLL